MLPITYYFIAHPLVGLGFGLLIALCIHNVFRRQVRIALGLWLLIIIVLFYIKVQVSDDELDGEPTELRAPELAK
jgi:peptidoglycan/LPS O-acetylase OafA/YrhL